ncbi:unnamed protein product [Sphagnum jensenii]
MPRRGRSSPSPSRSMRRSSPPPMRTSPRRATGTTNTTAITRSGTDCADSCVNACTSRAWTYGPKWQLLLEALRSGLQSDTLSDTQLLVVLAGRFQ